MSRNGINKKNIKNIYKLSHLQQGLLFHHLYSDKEAGSYLSQKTWCQKGGFNPDLFHQAFQSVIDRHDVYRTRFFWESLSHPVQIVEKHVDLPFDFVDWQDVKREGLDERMTQFLEQDRQRGFDLTKPCLMRITIIQLEEDEYQIIWSEHHIITDGWSGPIVMKEVLDNYKMLLNGRAILNKPVPQYESYIAWLLQQDKTSMMNFWRSQLEEFEAPTPLGVNHKSLSIRDELKNIEEFSIVFTEEETRAIQGFAASCQVTVNNVVQLAWATLLSRYSGEKEVMFGITVSGRSAELPGVEEMVGLFINTLPLSISINSSKTVKESIIQLRDLTEQVNRNSYVGLTELKTLSGIEGDVPLFYSLLVFENYPFDETLGSQMNQQISSVNIYEETNYPVTITVGQGALLSIKLNIAVDYIEHTLAENMRYHLKQVIHSLIKESTSQITSIEMLSPKEKQQLLVEWNDTAVDYPREKTIHQLFEEQVEKTPNNTAIVYEESSLSYQALNQRANQLARLIQAQYQDKTGEVLIPDTLIPLCLDRSLEMIIAILAVLKAGGAYVPIDSELPLKRKEHIINDIKARLVLSHSASEDDLPVHIMKVICVDEMEGYAQLQNLNLNTTMTSRNLAYVIYTSGSTGKPKGVMVEHRSILNQIMWIDSICGISDKTISLQQSSMMFDASVWQYFSPLLNGGYFVIVSKKKVISQYLFQSLSNHAINILECTPSYIENIYDKLCIHSLEVVMLSGEAITNRSIKISQALFPNARILNTYGPTEMTINSMWNEVKSSSDLSIGKPVFNTGCYVLGADLSIMPIGVLGELFHSGGGLARGYLNQSKLTDEKFIDNPFATEEDKSQGRNLRLYKTGDLVRWLPDGNLEFIGRIDDQVKVRGFRIELGEIETVLSKHSDVSQCVVLAKGEGQDKKLVAYVVSDADKELDQSSIRNDLKEQLPDYMIPSFFIPLDSLPLNRNGKIDRKALPVPLDDVINQGALSEKCMNQHEFRLLQLWKEVLHAQRVSLEDSFFEVGGHSLMAVRLMVLINDEFGTRVSVDWLFRHVSIREQAFSLVSDTETNLKYQPIISFNTRMSAVPLFMAHSGLGGAEVYSELSNQLCDIISLHGINPYNLYHTPKLDALEKLCSKYVQLITDFYDGQSMYLGGWSFGGELAFEMARQLTQQGLVVKNVFIIDSAISKANPSAEIAVPQVNDYPDNYQEQLKLVPRELLDLALEDAGHNAWLSDRYQATCYDGPVTLFRATEREAEDEDLTNGWGDYCSNLNVIQVDGDHFTIMDGASSRFIADSINDIVFQDLQKKTIDNRAALKEEPVDA